MLSHYPDCIVSRCEKYVIRNFVSNWILLLIFGLISVFGNAVVMYYKIKCLWKKCNRRKQVQIYNALVFNLSFSDLLMGIYLTSLAFEIRNKVARNVYFGNTPLCNVLGILNFISSQVSLTLLTIISLFRLLSVAYPYQKQHLKIAVSLIVLTWFIWIPVSILPVIQQEPLATFFTSGIHNEHFTNTPENYVSIFKIKLLIKNLLKLAPENSNVKHVLGAALRENSRDVMVKTLEKLGIIDTSIEAWHFSGYYTSKYSCSINFLVQDREVLPHNYFTLCIILYNVLSCVFIVIAYGIISVQVFGCHSANPNNFRRRTLSSFYRKSSRKKQTNEPNLIRDYENQKLFCRMFIVIVTDILCWIPLCVLFFVFWFEPIEEIGKPMFSHLHQNFQIAVLWIIPLNSILNPYIYSFHLWQDLFKACKKKLSTSTSQ